MLYIVSTPIGNLDDLSIRQARTLINSEIILAEDTRSAKILLNSIKTLFPNLIKNQSLNPRLISYYKEKELEKLPEIIELLKESKTISLISQSGTPLISDPGFFLVKTCIKENIEISFIPGPTAFISSLVLSGFNPSKFIFFGFLPKKPSEKINLLKNFINIKNYLNDLIGIFYESPLRIDETLRIIDQINPNFDIVIARELTKKFEQILRGKPKDFLNQHFKGEIVLLIK